VKPYIDSNGLALIVKDFLIVLIAWLRMGLPMYRDQQSEEERKEKRWLFP
jgi:hypothetical protein